MPETPGSVTKLDYAKTSVTIVHSQYRDALQRQLRINMTSQSIALHSIILQIGQVPGNDRLGDDGIRGGAVHQRRLCFQSYAQSNVRGVAADRAEHGPDLIVVDHLYNFVA